MVALRKSVFIISHPVNFSSSFEKIKLTFVLFRNFRKSKQNLDLSSSEKTFKFLGKSHALFTIEITFCFLTLLVKAKKSAEILSI
jgi:hypothetical protein